LTYRILIVDDDPHIREVINVALRKAGMAVVEARDGKEALARFARDTPDLIVLDIGMPELDGLEVCRQVRKSSDVPILFLTARDEEIDRVLGLEIGGDDYVTKPFSPRELVARAKAVLRRGRDLGDDESNVIVASPLSIDLDRRLVTKRGVPVDTTALEFDLLRVLASRPGIVFSRAQLLQRVWDYDFLGDERVVDVHIGLLRKKIEDNPSEPALIRTVRGVGYKFDRAD
jgi:two-component system OmpR family response regulator